MAGGIVESAADVGAGPEGCCGEAGDDGAEGRGGTTGGTGGVREPDGAGGEPLVFPGGVAAESVLEEGGAAWPKAGVATALINTLLAST